MNRWTTSVLVMAIVAAITLPLGARTDDRKDRERDGHRDGRGVAFAFMGDMPYGPAAEPQFDRVVAEINADRQVDFVIHAGDIKSGSERCDNDLVLRRFAQYQTLRVPFVYTPGDNEWTDCHRANNGAYNPLERLAFVRQVFFPRPGVTTGGKAMRVVTQANGGTYPEFVENVRFEAGGVVFGMVHVVGSNNDLDPWTGIDASDSYATPRADRMAEFQRREAAAVAWVDEVFASASNAAGVILTIQANPNFELPPANQQRLGFNRFLDRLATRAAEFKRPVLLMHGDNHVFFMDKPLANLRFTRMQTFGSGQVHWVKVRVDADAPGVFTVEQRVVAENLAR